MAPLFYVTGLALIMDAKSIKRFGLDIAAVAFVLALAFLGVFKPADDALKNMRFSLGSRPVTGDIVFLAIDPVSIRDVGVWPWPRAVHAKVIDQLVADDAADIFIDIDFSSLSNAENDAELARALQDTGGFVALAAFAQAASVTDDNLLVNAPLEQFAQHSEIAVVNVNADTTGLVRTYPYGEMLDGTIYPSVASFLAGYPAAQGTFNVDFGINASEIDQISIADLLAGKVDLKRIKDKQVVIGASALELRDTLTVPRFGNMPGPLMQVLAAETLKQNRVLTELGWPSVVSMVLLLLGIVIATRKLLGLASALIIGLVVCAVAEVGALYMQAELGFLMDSMACHASLAALALVGFISELDFRALMIKSTTHDRDTTRSILNQVISDNFDGVIVVSGEGRILAASGFAEAFFGFNLKQSAQTVIADFLPPLLYERVSKAFAETANAASQPEVREALVETEGGLSREIEYVITLSTLPVVDKNTPAASVACLTFRDVTEKNLHQRRLEYIAKHDPLTGAFSRTRLTEFITELAADKAKDPVINVFMVDLARFKAVNDMLGHDHGDALLKQVTERMREMDGACVARMGGDSFALVRQGHMSEVVMARFCEALVAKLTQLYLLGEHRAIIGVRLGVATSETSGSDPDVLIAHADTALSAAKETLIASTVLYNPQMALKLNETKAMEIALNNAMGRQEFSLRYQPQVDLPTGKFIGAEALARWHSAELGEVRPDVFIRLAEETGLILDIGRWVIEEACCEAVLWPDHTHMSVNISPMQFEYADVLAHVYLALEKSGLPAERLEAEVTEGVLIANSDLVIEALLNLQNLGMKIALDDFGTGYSSLSYLEKLPLDKIKIDQAFVRGLPGNQHAEAVVRSITTLSQSLGKLVVAEGIETQEQAEFLGQVGCHIGQGYYFGKPMKGAEIRERFFAKSDRVGARLAG